MQRKVLTPNHFEDLGDLFERIMDFIAYYDESAKPINGSYTVSTTVAKFDEKFGTD